MLSALFQGLAATFGLGITAIFVGIQLLNEKYSYKSIGYLPRSVWDLKFYMIIYSIAIIFPLVLLMSFDEYVINEVLYKFAISIEVSFVGFLITYTALKIHSLIKSLNPSNFFEIMMQEIKAKKSLTKNDLDTLFDMLLEIVQKAIRNNDELLAIEGIRRTIDVYKYYLQTVKIVGDYDKYFYTEHDLAIQLYKYLQTSKMTGNQDIILEILKTSLNFFSDFSIIKKRFGGPFLYVYDEISELVISDIINSSIEMYLKKDYPMIFIVLSDIEKTVEKLTEKISKNPPPNSEPWDFSVDLLNYLIKPISAALNNLGNNISVEKSRKMDHLILNILLTLQKIGKTIVKVENVSFYLSGLNDSIFEFTKSICKLDDFGFSDDAFTDNLNEYFKAIGKNVYFPTYIEKIFIYISEIVELSLSHKKWYPSYKITVDLLMNLGGFKNPKCKKYAIDAIIRIFYSIQKVYSKNDKVFVDFICFLNEALQKAPELKTILYVSANDVLSTEVKDILFENLEECQDVQKDKNKD